MSLVRTLSWAYSNAGDLVSASDPAATYTYSYDALGRVTSEGQDITGLNPVLQYARDYNALSRITTLQAIIDSTDDFENTYTYDNLQRLTRLQQQDPAALALGWRLPGATRGSTPPARQKSWPSAC